MVDDMPLPSSLADTDYTGEALAEVRGRMNNLFGEFAAIAKAETDETGNWAPASASRLTQLDEAQRILDRLYATLRGVREAVADADSTATAALLQRANTAAELPGCVIDASH